MQQLGKSILLANVFLRYEQAFPNATIVVASFDKELGLTDVVVWKDHPYPTDVDDEFYLRRESSEASLRGKG